MKAGALAAAARKNLPGGPCPRSTWRSSKGRLPTGVWYRKGALSYELALTWTCSFLAGLKEHLPRILIACISPHVERHMNCCIRSMPNSSALTCFGCVAMLLPRICAGAGPDAQTIINRSVAAIQRDWAAEPEYSYNETDRDEDGSKTYLVSMIDGSPYRMLIARNGRPLSASGQAEQKELLRKTTHERDTESQSQHDRRVEKYEADRKRDHVLMEQLADAFDFKITGERVVGSRPVYVLQATPRKGYQPPVMQAQVLPGMEGRLWIDKASYEWVKVTARVIHPVSIEGFLAQVEPGTFFELDKQPVSGGVWLPSQFRMKSRSKIFFLIGHNTAANETYFNYRRESESAQNGVTRPGH